MANVTGKLRFFARVDHQVVKGQKTLDFKLEIGEDVITGGNIDYKGSIRVKILLLQKSLANGVGPTQMIN